MKSICLCFEVHQPVRLNKFRFFDRGKSHYYYDDQANGEIIRRISQNCYLPSNELIADLINKYKGRFSVAFFISGIAIDLLRRYAPDVIQSFARLSATGCVEFLAGTYSHSYVALQNKEEFKSQVKSHASIIKELFGKEPAVFINTDLIYTDEIGLMVNEMGFKAIVAAGPAHILKWKNPNYLYSGKHNPALKVLLQNHRLSDDISVRFSNTNLCGPPLTPKKYVARLDRTPSQEEIVNLVMDYETLGERHNRQSGIFKFMASLPGVVYKKTDFEFRTPTAIAERYNPVSAIKMPEPNNLSGRKDDVSAWFENALQQEAFQKLYDLYPLICRCNNQDLLIDWQYLQASDHFKYMNSKYFSDDKSDLPYNPYQNPYEAFMNYMNVLNDFKTRLTQEVERNFIHLQQNATGLRRSFNGYLA